MKPLPVTIRPMTRADIPAVVAIHRQQFPGSRSTSLGQPYLRKMYRWFIENQPGLVFVAEADGQVQGFIAGAIGGYGRRIFRYALAEVILGLALHPWLLLRRQTFSLWRSYLQALLPARRPAPLPTPAAQPPLMRCSLSSIAVRREAQGCGAGRTLVEALEASALRRGAQIMTLSVRQDNLAARALYERCGWSTSGKDDGFGSVFYIKRLTGSQ